MMILLAQMPDEGITVLATMATPAVLLLANAMMILSTNQRPQSILDRVRETELTIAGESLAPETADLTLLQEFLVGHAKRAPHGSQGVAEFLQLGWALHRRHHRARDRDIGVASGFACLSQRGVFRNDNGAV